MNIRMTLAVTIAASGMLAFPAQAQNRRTIEVVERATTDVVSVRGGTAADNVGDVLTFSNEVFDAQNRVKVGTDQGYCVRLAVGKAFECQWTIFLKEGQISVQGPFYVSRDSKLSITGGTGAFATARGEMLLRAVDAKGSAFRFTYNLR